MPGEDHPSIKARDAQAHGVPEGYGIFPCHSNGRMPEPLLRVEASIDDSDVVDAPPGADSKIGRPVVHVVFLTEGLRKFEAISQTKWGTVWPCWPVVG